MDCKSAVQCELYGSQSAVQRELSPSLWGTTHPVSRAMDVDVPAVLGCRVSAATEAVLGGVVMCFVSSFTRLFVTEDSRQL